MQTQLVLNIDNQTIELANFYAKEKGLSINEMIEFYLKWIVWNETFIRTQNIQNLTIQSEIKENNSEKWKNLEFFLSKNRFKLPSDYKFNREELYDR
jgi:hypothetical protein